MIIPNENETKYFPKNSIVTSKLLHFYVPLPHISKSSCMSDAIKSWGFYSIPTIADPRKGMESNHLEFYIALLTTILLNYLCGDHLANALRNRLIVEYVWGS
jgi:hypothetical protein